MQHQGTNLLRPENDDDDGSGEKFSIYRSQSSTQPSPRQCSLTLELCPEDALMGDEQLPLESNTPKNHRLPITTIVGKDQSLATVTLVYRRHPRPLADADHHSVSLDSGYYTEASAPNEILDPHSDASSCSFSSGTPATGSGSVLRTASATITSHDSSSSPSSHRALLSSLFSGSTESMDEFGTMQDKDLGPPRSLHDHLQHHNTADSGPNTPTSGTIRAHRSRTRNHGPTRPQVRRCLSLLTEDTDQINVQQGSLVIEDRQNRHLTPPSSRTTEAARCFQHPESPDIGAVQNKRGKMIEFSPTKDDTIAVPDALGSLARTEVMKAAVKPDQTLHRKPLPTNDEQIMSAVSRSAAEPDLIGDFTVPYILPTVNGRHQDLRYISGETLARLLQGEFQQQQQQQQVASYEIIDCRYPYEFDGGHIRGAKNLYTREQITEQLLVERKPEQRPTIGEPSVPQHGHGNGAGATRRHILVFHCEFSVQRGPTLSRFLRNHDRNLNVDRYPALHYPEVYLLHGGYKQFFTSYSSLCDPIAYRPMLDREYGDEYHYFRAKLRGEKTSKKRSRLTC